MRKTKTFYRNLEKIMHYDWQTYFSMVDQLIANELQYVNDDFYETER